MRFSAVGGALPGFHWAIFIPTASPHGHAWHATNREGGWKREYKESDSVPFSMSLVLSQKIGAIAPSALPACCDVLNAIPADGTPSPNTGEPFSCRVWAKDAMIALQNKGFIVLTESPADVEQNLLDEAGEYKPLMETGNDAQVNN